MTVTTPDLRGRLAALLRMTEAIARTWHQPGRVNRDRHMLRVDSMHKRWPELAALLDALLDTLLDDSDRALLVAGAADVEGCPVCAGPVSVVRQTPNPKYAFDRPGYRVEDGQRDSTSVLMPRWVFRLDPCLHEVDADTAQRMWEGGVQLEEVPLDAIALIAAEMERVRVDRGITLEQDEQLTEGQLAWAAWCILDRTANPQDTSLPASWPLDPRLWKPQQTPIRALTVVAGMVASEIDRRLAAQEQV